MKIVNRIRKMTTLLVIFGLALCLICSPRYASAQATAQISGLITDASGAIVPGAQVKITKTDTAAVRITESKADGTYIFPALAVGPYKLEVTKTGFQSFLQTGIVLQVNTNPAINVTLQVGNVSQTVEVEANAAMVETQSNAVGAVIEPEQVVDLPLNNRQPTQLIALAGGAVNTSSAAASGGMTGTLDYPTAVSFSVAGSQRNATNYYLDGSSNMDYRTNIGSPMPFPDALQEFKVESSALPADTGSRPGGVVTAITKSGTNQIHGDVFEFLRNGVLDADAYNFPSISGSLGKPTRDSLKRNQFGGVIGGPIKRDKLFGFYGFQGTTERQSQLPTTRTVPTPAMLGGDFTAFLAPPCQSSQQYLNDTVAGQPLVTAHHSNILNSNWLTTPSAAISKKVAALFPVPNNPCGTVTTSGYQHDNEFQHVGRVDWVRSTADQVFVRYFISDYNLASTLTQPGNILTSSGVGLADRAQNVGIGETHIFNTRVISSTRLSFNRTATQRLGNPTIPNLCSLGMNATCPVPHIISLLYLEPGYQGWDYENAYGVSENFGWQLGPHQINFGAAFEHVQMNGDGTFQVNPLPGFTSGGSSYTGNNVADFVTGNADGFGQGNGQLSRDGQNMPSLYFQDNYKITHKFQLNYGLRWEPYYPQHNKYGMATDWTLAGYQAGKVSQKYVNAPPGAIYPGDPGSNGNSDTLDHAAQFSPRVGIVWDPRGKGLETIRAGYGMFYDTSLMWNAMHVVLNGPWGNTVSFVPLPVDPTQAASATGGIANPWFGQPGGNIFPTPLNPPANYPFAANGAFVYQQQDMVPSNSQQWNLSVQKQIGANWMVSATYLGSRTTHLWLGNNLNPDVLITSGMTYPGLVANNVSPSNPATGSCTILYQGTPVTYSTCNSTSKVSVSGINNESARKLLNLINPSQGYKMNGGVIGAQSIGNAAYHGLLAVVQHRLSNGFSINANYTWSHCLDNGEVGQDLGASFQNPANPKADWGNCSFDRRQLFNLSLVAQSPKFSSAMTQRILGNWNGSGIFTSSTGGYVNVLAGNDISLIGGSGVPGTGGSGNDRPNQVGDPFTAGSIAANPSCVGPAQVKTSNHWFNPCAFVNQAAGTFGNTHRNSLLGPGSWNFDAAVWRTFPITERFKLDFRFEGFNVFNHPQWGAPGATLSSTSSLGLISTTSTGVNNQRIGQAALKVTF